MKYFRRILVHYLTMALRGAGVRIDSDTLSEIEGMCDDLDEYIHTVVKEEATQVLAETLAAIVAEEHEQPRWYWCEVSDLHAEHKWLAVKEPTMEAAELRLVAKGWTVGCVQEYTGGTCHICGDPVPYDDPDEQSRYTCKAHQ